ncbi:MAG TPA: glycosyltransferase [Longimicrobiaceae bacterium]
MPRVSVVVPAYNYAAYVGACLESVLGQRGFADLEVVVVDDGSTDGTREAVASFLRDPRVVLVAHERNRGHVAAVNAGLRRAGGEYLARVDADDFWDPEFLARTVPVLDAHPGVGMVHTACRLVDAEGRTTSERGADIPYPDGFRGDPLPWLLFDNFVPPAGALFRRGALELIGGAFSEEVPYSEDWRLWLAIARRHPVAFVDAPLAAYRVHGRNLHSALQRTRRAEESERRILDEVFADPLLAPEHRALRGRVYARHARRHADAHFGFGDRAGCLRCLRDALRHDPASLADPGFWKRGLLASLPEPLYRVLRRL